MLLLSLIAVLAGTPLRLAEAADDLARSLMESPLENGIEVIDGGVGDDSGVTIRSEIARPLDSSNEVNLLPTIFTLVASCPNLIVRANADPPPRHSQPLHRRHLLLLCFLC
jgi:hypothetical protein